ncbi:glycosyltransferase [Niabella sp. W65]|nr:glycosyltransferase [Niabella sp. W65]MCH7367408.1 glycosyltransferase [Niabella sp. W65]
MHYGIITFGSRGDIQPYIALALGLKNRGHWVGILGNENFSELVTAHEIDFYSLPGNIEAMLQTPQMTGILKSANTIAYFKELRKLTRQMQGGIIEKMITHCKAFDVLIATPLTIMWVFSVAESLKKPWAIIQLSVPTVPTAEFPFPGLDLFNNRIYNRFTYRLIRWFFWNENKKDINTHRAYLNLPPLKKSLIQIIDEQEILHLYAFSRFLISRPADWPRQADITGFLTAKAPTASKERCG